jgi:hypothetical protein
MANARAGALLACAATVTLAGCFGATFSPDAPEGVSLAGSWKLDHAASDDGQKVLAKMREQAMTIIKRQQEETSARADTAPPDPMADSSPPEGGATPPAGPAQAGPAQGGAGQGAPRRGDPLRRSPMAAIIHALMERGDYLTVRQSPREFVLDYGTSSRTFTPGGHSVVSAAGGVGDQNSGWRHKSYVITIRAQNGPEITDVYSLSPDGAHLLETLSISSAELPAEQIKRVYNRTSEQAPRQAPTTD